jgi:single-strand DNA-binding protein
MEDVEMCDQNVAVLRGVVTSEPRVRALPSGDIVTNIELTTRLERGAVSVPVVVHGSRVTVGRGDSVVVTGAVARRFFRAGGITQSRTEVVADRVVPATHRRRIDRALQAVVSRLGRISSTRSARLP